MSSAPTDCRVPDPTDAKADGNFGNHRAGYGSDRLQRAEAWARKGYTLAAGEGLVLCAEIDRLRTGVDLLKAQYEDAWKVGMEAVEKMRRLEEEIDRLRKELEIATSMLGEQVPLLNRLQDENDRLRGELVLVLQSITISAEHQRAERILAALRKPSLAVINTAALRLDSGDQEEAMWAIRAAVTAAEREVGHG